MSQDFTDPVLLQLSKKQEPMPETDDDVVEEYKVNPVKREKTNCTIFLGYTSNMISAGIRETIRFLAQHNMVVFIQTL